MRRLRSAFMVILSSLSLAVVTPPGQSTPPPEAAQARVSPLPDAEKELSRLPGVSIIRDPRPVEKDWDGGGYFYAPVSGLSRHMYGALLGSLPEKDACISYGSLSWTLQGVTRVRNELIFGASLLPREGYTVKITGPDLNMEQVRAKLFSALGQTFGVHVSQQKREIRVLVLSKGENWNRDGFKSYRWLGSWTSPSADNKSWDFTGYDMDEIARTLEGELPVINDTGLQGRFRGNIAGGSLSHIQKELVKHGLRLREAFREMDVVIIERKGNAGRAISSSAPPVE